MTSSQCRVGAWASPMAVARTRAVARPIPRSRNPRLRVRAGIDPPDLPKPREEEKKHGDWFQMLLSRFNPISEKATNATVLDFEKPLVELDHKIREVRPGVGWRKGRGARCAMSIGGHCRLLSVECVRQGGLPCGVGSGREPGEVRRGGRTRCMKVFSG